MGQKGGIGVKERLQNLLRSLSPLGICFAFGIAAFITGIPLAYVFSHLKTLGGFWLPILCVYWLFLSLVLRQVIIRRSMIKERFLYGDELFFRYYPREKRKEERRIRRQARREERRNRAR